MATSFCCFYWCCGLPGLTSTDGDPVVSVQVSQRAEAAWILESQNQIYREQTREGYACVERMQMGITKGGKKKHNKG
eukprot:365940-Chlamydomonas_euryale.AAC.25